VRLRRRLLLGVATILGAAVAVMPALAGSETIPTIDAVNSTGLYNEQTHSWSPSQATIAPGGTVTLNNPTAVIHGVRWVSGPATPVCSSGVPVGTSAAASGTQWSGTCTFTTPGAYTFYCTVHGAAMAATITVSAGGPTTSTTTSTPTQPPPRQTTTTGSPSTSGQPGAGITLGSGGALDSPLLGGTATAIKLGPGPHGTSVHGSIEVSRAGAGARLEVDLLAARASLARVAGSAQVRVGRLVRRSLPAGRISFTVPLDAWARRALRSHRRLALTVEVLLAPRHGSATRVARTVLLHR
jgi:plastocyanin